MDADTRRAAAELLLAAYDTGVPVEPLRKKFADLTVADAYAIQLQQVESWRAEGAQVKGHKVGLTSVAIQQQVGVDQPDYGHLLDSMFFLENTPVPVRRFLQPRIEPQIAFVLSVPLRGPGVTAADAIAAVDFLLPALEIIDSRIRDWKIGLVDTVADNASSGGVVLGSRPSRLEAVDLPVLGCALHRSGELVGTGAGGAVLGSPVNALVWLANTLGSSGVTLEAGEVILPGSVCAAVPVAAGDAVTATFSGLGSVKAVFAEEKWRDDDE